MTPDFDMSPYGFYVWGSYGISAVVLIGLAVRAWLAGRPRRWSSKIGREHV